MRSIRSLDTRARAWYWCLPIISLVNFLSWGGTEFSRDRGTISRTAKILSSLDALASKASACCAHGPHHCGHCCQYVAQAVQSSRRVWTDAPSRALHCTQCLSFRSHGGAHPDHRTCRRNHGMRSSFVIAGASSSVGVPLPWVFFFQDA